MHRALSLIGAGFVLGTMAFAAPSHALLVNYADFSSTDGLTLVGSTATVGSVLRLTPADTGQAGAAYSTSPVTLGAGNTFSTQFTFQFTNPGGIDAADGITFVLAASATGLGTSGGGIGYGGVGNSVAIELDTFNNGYGDGYSNNHVGVDTNGNVNSDTLSYVYNTQTCSFGTTDAGCLSNGQVWTATITYDGALLNVTLTDPTADSYTGTGGGGGQMLASPPGATAFHAIVDYPIDIGALLGTNTAYVGFTSGTGSGYENHDILSWEFSDSAVLPPVDVPEPGTIALLGTAMLGLLARRRRA